MLLSEHVASDRMVRWGPASVLASQAPNRLLLCRTTIRSFGAHKQDIDTNCLEGQPAQQPHMPLSSNLLTFCSHPRHLHGMGVETMPDVVAGGVSLTGIWYTQTPSSGRPGNHLLHQSIIHGVA